MKAALRVLALTALLGAGGLWLFAGANRGWTKTSVPVKTLDEVTGIEGVTYERRFVPGVDLLGAAAAGAGLVFGVSFLVRSKFKPT